MTQAPEYRLVPVEPTEAMYDAAVLAYQAWHAAEVPDSSFTHNDVWRAMIAAAPLPAAPAADRAVSERVEAPADIVPGSARFTSDDKFGVFTADNAPPADRASRESMPELSGLVSYLRSEAFSAAGTWRDTLSGWAKTIDALARSTDAPSEPVAWWRWSYEALDGGRDADVQICTYKPTCLPDNGYPWEPLYGKPLATPPAATTSTGWAMSEAEYDRLVNSLMAQLGEISEALEISEEDQSCANGNDAILAAIEDLKQPAAATSTPCASGEADEIAKLRAQVEDLQAEVDDLNVNDERDVWPDWASAILKTVREHSGYDGYDDQDGIDLPAEVAECLAELAAQADRANEVRAAALAATQAPAVPAADAQAAFKWHAVDGKQHDTGRVTHGERGSYFATTASPEDARLIAEALNARTPTASNTEAEGLLREAAATLRICNRECGTVPSHSLPDRIDSALASNTEDARSMGAASERTPMDFALEHAEYLAKGAERLVEAINEEFAARQRLEEDDDEDRDSDITALNVDHDAAVERISEAIRSVQLGVYGFRTRRDRAALTRAASTGGAAS